MAPRLIDRDALELFIPSTITVGVEATARWTYSGLRKNDPFKWLMLFKDGAPALTLADEDTFDRILGHVPVQVTEAGPPYTGPNFTPASVPETNAAQNSEKVAILPAVLGTSLFVVFLGFLGMGWRYLRRRRRPSITQSPGDTDIAPYPLPGEVEVDEKRPRIRLKQEMVIDSTSEVSRAAHISNEAGTTDNDNRDSTTRVTTPLENVDQDVTVPNLPGSTHIQRQGIFHHTDSGWRLAVERRSEPYEARR
ncbi:hypothetical protein AAF712_010305, partial [Marasmius tenuissimus]